MTAGLLLLLLAALLAAAERRNRRQLLALGATPQSRRRLLPDLCALAALALLSWPQSVGPAPEEKPAGAGPTLALVVDVSASMAAADTPPTRLERARAELRRLIEGLPQARFTLLAFAGEAIRQVPPTADREALLFFVERLATGLVDAPGSAPEEAVLAAQQILREEPGERAVVLFSDGERTVPGRAPAPAADIPVFCVSSGSPEGGAVPDAGGRPRRDETGQTILSRLDLSRLQRLAEATAGEVLGAEGNASAVTPLLARWGGAAATPAAAPRQLLLALAVVFLLARQLPVAAGRRRRGLAALLAGSLLAVAACRTPDGETGGDLFRRAANLSRRGESEEAGRLFAEAAQRLEGDERAAALFNQGTLLLLAGDAPQALSPLEQAILLLPGDAAIRRNLALALHAAGADRMPGAGAGEGTSDGGEETGMNRQQALQLLESVRPASEAAAATRAQVRETAVRRDW